MSDHHALSLERARRNKHNIETHSLYVFEENGRVETHRNLGRWSQSGGLTVFLKGDVVEYVRLPDGQLRFSNGPKPGPDHPLYHLVT